MQGIGIVRVLWTYAFFVNDEDFLTATLVADVVGANGNPSLTNSLTDNLISAEVLLPQGEDL